MEQLTSNKILAMSTENQTFCRGNLTQERTCDNIGDIILPANKLSRFSDPEEIMGCKWGFGALLLSILGESIVHALHGEFE